MGKTNSSKFRNRHFSRRFQVNYHKRGTAEQWIKEGKQAVKMTRLSCHRFRSNEVRLWLSVIAYNLGNLWRRLALPHRISNCSLTSLQQRLVKTVGRLIKHARYYWLLLAESHLTRRWTFSFCIVNTSSGRIPLQLEVQKRFAHGLMFRTEYDWSRNLTNSNLDGEWGYMNSFPQDPWNLRAEYSNEQFQYRHKFLIYYVYELPVGRGQKWLGNTNKFVDGALGGWRVSGITIYHSGDAITPTFENPGTEIGWYATRPDRVPGPLYAGRQSGHDTVDGVQWFSPTAFAPPQPWQYGNGSPWSIFGPGFGDWDVSVMKQFRLPKGESNKLEFKVDFFNLPNHYNVGDPSTGVADTRDGGVPDPTTGKSYGGAGGYQPRLIQIGLRLVF